MRFRFSTSRRASALAFVAMLSGVSSVKGLTFNITYDSSLNGYADLAQVKAANTFVANEFSHLFTNNMTVNIKVAGDPTAGTLGFSNSNYEDQAYTYGQVRSALLANTPGDAMNLPLKDPTNGSSFTTTSAQAKALGLALGGSASDSDGTFTFGTSQTYTFDPNNRQVVGAFDFISTAEHEFSEILGRQSNLNNANDGLSPFDLFRYSAPGVRSFDPTTNANGDAVSAYFSTDNGATNLMSFNDVTGGDIHDWAGANHDSFDAFGPDDDAQPITGVDIKAMEAIGYTVAVPLPSAAGMGLGLLSVLALAGAVRRKIRTN